MHSKGNKNRRCNSAMGSKTYHRHDHGKRGYKAPLVGAKPAGRATEAQQQEMKTTAE
ncbi:MAG: hypothetical protein JWL88_44 [Parcubacteria group bacterium]|nr:hypothetical protein [Parcubacteria group bacterium]